jgi:hypothetical protein
MNQLYYGDNQPILRSMPSSTVDLIYLDPPTRDMITAASTAGFYKSEFWQKSYPRLQILTIEQILAGAVVQMPPETGTFLAAQKVRKKEGSQNQLGI